MKKYLYVAGFVYAVVAIAHLLRVLRGVEMTIDEGVVPMYVSWWGFFVASILSVIGYIYAKRCR